LPALLVLSPNCIPKVAKRVAKKQKHGGKAFCYTAALRSAMRSKACEAKKQSKAF
jgi:hypothetical protein